MGAGAVVVRDVPAFALVVGNPARRIGWVDKAGVRLVFVGNTAHDSLDGSRYRLNEQTMEVEYDD